MRNNYKITKKQLCLAKLRFIKNPNLRIQAMTKLIQLNKVTRQHGYSVSDQDKFPICDLTA